MATLTFDFFKMFNDLEVHSGLRVSLWQDNVETYLMPCEFVNIIEIDHFYRIKLNVLDPSDKISNSLIGKKFLFGHPGKIIGYGILNEI